MRWLCAGGTASVTSVNPAIRKIPEAQLDQALDLTELVFHEKDSEEERARCRAALRRCARTGAYDGDTLVGLVAAHPFRLSVPGGDLACAGLDHVAVAPTHRRRGLLSRMLNEQWRHCAEAGQPLSCLWASEEAIYGRFGYAHATEAYTIEIDSTRPLALRITPDPRPLRLLDHAEAPAVLGPRYEAGRFLRAGRLARDDDWWRTHVLCDEEDEGPARVVALGEPGAVPAGYAVYRTEAGNSVTRAPGVIEVYELEADSAPVAAALWDYLAAIDLTGKVVAWVRPTDDPLLHFAADRDQVRVTKQYPALWLRLVDVHAALTARSWAAPVDLVLDVGDATLPANHGRFRLTAGPGEPTSYRPADDPPDLVLDVRELAACYLGGTPLRRLLTAGLATERTPGAADRLDAALRTDLLPFAHEDY
ncbi:GNAT family N-acetyltransferase [Streptomyces pinistramenti]|uniref:GNAT family N-acetyltransferase n=1 Tax=Streptomyces pinistramenti TaxID=2884812 RepID=UPI001D08023E|nr:GNAT family N-acetyltransferase [Streptomyces pinistramenti]MCB5907410.1 GNAT family N-acetyltransferase [Streptomyces pinistramenti]